MQQKTGKKKKKVRTFVFQGNSDIALVHTPTNLHALKRDLKKEEN